MPVLGGQGVPVLIVPPPGSSTSACWWGVRT
jgi:hypothetical protein